ncbi:MAG: hypothetical protein KTR17_03995 [Cellvibrionaceae bacterium]|nr:hypothetical protein [Cellvibrionaceae bacterium]
MVAGRKKPTWKPINSTFDFNDYPFYWISRVGNRYTHVMEVELKKVNMNITTWRIALILRELGTLSMTEIAEYAVGRMPTIAKSIYRMSDAGLVTVGLKASDGRVTQVSLTKDGVNLIEYVTEKTEKIIDRSFEGMPSAEIKQLNALLKKIFHNLD